jgi:hypothetical protein
VTVQVTDCPNGFHHDLKFARRGLQLNRLRLPTSPGLNQLGRVRTEGLYSKKREMSPPATLPLSTGL